MKLATLNNNQHNNKRDGQLIVVNSIMTHGKAVPEIATTMQGAIDNWSNCKDALQQVYDNLNEHPESGFLLSEKQLLAPLPRAYQFLDGSAYLNHVELVRKARKADIPQVIYQEPLVYQGVSDSFLAANAPICALEEWGIDFEAEIIVVTSDVKQGIKKSEITDKIILLGLMNDISLRNLIPNELAKGFGFLQSKPASSIAPVFVTPDEVADQWSDFKLDATVGCYRNDVLIGENNASVDMHFDFGDLIQHVCKTRKLTAGTIIGSGTISNYAKETGVSCLAEKRMEEIIAFGEAKTPFLNIGERIKIEVLDNENKNLFGSIEQIVTKFG